MKDDPALRAIAVTHNPLPITHYGCSGVVDRSRPAFGERNELRLARDCRVAARFPVVGGLADALLAARDEVPPDMARADRLAAEQHQARRRAGSDSHVSSLSEHEHLALAAFTPVAFDGALRDVSGALFVLGQQVEARAGAEN